MRTRLFQRLIESETAIVGAYSEEQGRIPDANELHPF